MTDYSKQPLGARGARGRELQEKMRVLLGCEKADAHGHDFKKGSVKFEYKHSRLMTRNKSAPKQRRLHPTRSWHFENLRGQGGNKDYDHLILEGEAEGKPPYLFLIGSKELHKSFRKLSDFSVTLPLGGGKSRPLGKNSKFVWDHRVTEEELRARVDQYARSSENTERSLRAGILGESDEPGENAKKNTGVDPNSAEAPRSTGTKSTLQLPLPFKR